MSFPLTGFFSLMKNVHSWDSSVNKDAERLERHRFLTLESRSHSFQEVTRTQLREEIDEEFFDAYDTPQMSSSLQLLDSVAETQIAMNLFLNNKFQMAEERMASLSQKSMYHALGYSALVFIRATMTCDRQDLERATRVSKNASSVIDAFRAKFSISDSFYRLSGQTRMLTDQELHAELCYAESLLLRAILTFFHDESLSSFVRGALKIRACYQSYRECERLLNSEIWAGRDARMKAHFESGTHLGVGIFNLMLSTLPTRILRLLEVVGFSGDKVLLIECKTSFFLNLRETGRRQFIVRK
ncbi:Uncharacterized protein C32D5.6 [Toxocara canis]|uniref:Uncharacterized protein C32D5.6 n=1 Tax=Toxocara canis TaxID=6265 RepID=A0A0B2UU38_TOXCA|nr:Uncharacterized protein C32D5.6 [Toxocara canis]